jgi:hypothetical protein
LSFFAFFTIVAESSSVVSFRFFSFLVDNSEFSSAVIDWVVWPSGTISWLTSTFGVDSTVFAGVVCCACGAPFFPARPLPFP